jgi:hypothetical protein
MTAGIIVASIAALVAIFGYVYVQVGARRERVGRTFADALAAVHDLRGMPYLVRRRPANDAATRWELAKRLNEIHSRLDFHRAWLRVEAAPVAEPFEELVTQVRDQASEYMDWSLQQPPFESDPELVAHLSERFTYDGLNDRIERCVSEMRSFLARTWFAWLRAP